MPGSFFSNLFGWKQGGPFDERFIMHRFKSTRLAVLVGTIMLFAFFTHYAPAIVYYRKTN